MTEPMSKDEFEQARRTLDSMKWVRGRWEGAPDPNKEPPPGLYAMKFAVGAPGYMLKREGQKCKVLPSGGECEWALLAKNIRERGAAVWSEPYPEVEP